MTTKLYSSDKSTINQSSMKIDRFLKGLFRKKSNDNEPQDLLNKEILKVMKNIRNKELIAENWSSCTTAIYI